jgi:hypothetical protein
MLLLKIKSKLIENISLNTVTDVKHVWLYALLNLDLMRLKQESLLLKTDLYQKRIKKCEKIFRSEEIHSEK